MKKSILIVTTIIAFIAGSLVVTSCGSSSQKESESTDQHDMEGHDHDAMATANFSCPMHPGVTGKEGDKCSECGMFLTESSTDGEHEEEMHKMDTIAFSCPMHQNVTGKKGDMCSTCNMALVASSKKGAIMSCSHKPGEKCEMCSAEKDGMKCEHKNGETCPKCKKA